MASAKKVLIGVDVGGTNTDAVVVQFDTNPPIVLSSAKSPTTADITSGVKQAVSKAIGIVVQEERIQVLQVNIGTTHFVNALVQRQGLAKVTVLRLCGPGSRFLPPFSDFIPQLRSCLEGDVFMVDGGIEFDGREIAPINETEINKCVRSSLKKGLHNFVVCGIFSPVKPEQENSVKDIIQRIDANASVTLSHEIGNLNLLERENASILNECLKPLSKDTIHGFHTALDELGLKCPFYLIQNDGTIVSREAALHKPVCTFASGPTNSMRGAAFVSGEKDAIVVDIGGTTTDVGILVNGFPREASSQVKVGGIRTNFRMPDVLSIGLGGGSYVTEDNNDSVRVGPQSAGYNLVNEAFVFSDNGETHKRKLTATDVAVSAGLCQIGNLSNVKHLDPKLVTAAINQIEKMIQNTIDQMKTTSEDLPVILVGGGSILVQPDKTFLGASKLVIPDHSDVANAVGAALSQVSGSVDYVDNLMAYIDEQELETATDDRIREIGEDATLEEKEGTKRGVRKGFFEKARDKIVEAAVERAISEAVRAGAVEDSVVIVEKSDTSLSYLPGNATRLQVKAVGSLNVNTSYTDVIDSRTFVTHDLEADNNSQTTLKQFVTSTGFEITYEPEHKMDFELNIDSKTGEWILTESDIECISIGAGIVGCGGGGSPYLGKLVATKALNEGKTIRIVTPERLMKDADPLNDLVVPVAIMGAPLIVSEKLVGRQCIDALLCMQDLYQLGGYDNCQLSNTEAVEIKEDIGISHIEYYNQRTEMGEPYSRSIGKKQMVGIICEEIGGLNSVEPLVASAELNLPVLDCDGMGRAFPELQMYTPLIYGSKPYPSTLADEKGRRDVLLRADTAKNLEDHFRKIVVEMGCSGGVVISSLNKSEVLNAMIPYSYSRVWKIGRAVLAARQRKESPIEAVLEHENGQLLFKGKANDVRRETTGGFNKGFLRIAGSFEFQEKVAVVEFQNENLVVRVGASNDQLQVKACVPDLIAILDIDTGESIPTESLCYGQRVVVLVLPSHELLRTPEALAVVGPQAFGYKSDVEFVPCGPPQDVTPVGPKH